MPKIAEGKHTVAQDDFEFAQSQGRNPGNEQPCAAAGRAGPEVGFAEEYGPVDKDFEFPIQSEPYAELV